MSVSSPVLNIYPNPFTKSTTVDFGRDVEKAIITIYDVYGKLIEQYDVEQDNNYVITRGDKASGIYFMEVEIEEEKITFKLIID